MIPSQLQRNVVRTDTPAVYAHYIVTTNSLYPLALVCDEKDRLIGVIGSGEINPIKNDLIYQNCGEICNSNFCFLENGSEASIYSKARNIFAEKQLITLPIIDENKMPVRLFGKWQAFFRESYKDLPYFFYAHGLLSAAKYAKKQGYNRISTIEFGVAGGRGLIHMELYAREISRLANIEIDVYGFDSGKGLYSPRDYRDCPQEWIEGDFKMNINGLQSQLYKAKLVIGDICESTKTFLDRFNPAPIAFISVDVDHYTPTTAILDMLLQDHKYYVPVVTMYFDDVLDTMEFQGETLAIKEFNARNETIKISPEHTRFDEIWMHSESSINDWKNIHLSAMKWCSRFEHPLYTTKRTSNEIL
ncbi:CBS domain-containing protein [Lacrimispora aerotolerans]|uniref:hypothetical protein n=1 Tax=Lacrimispora aerotolerans TaxID=36832 RepID=UPI00068EC6AC|nr:hypothetical protein [Lacrimispora aerotolerans]